MLHHIYSDIDATEEQVDSLLNYRRYGQEYLNNYISVFFSEHQAAPGPPKGK